MVCKALYINYQIWSLKYVTNTADILEMMKLLFRIIQVLEKDLNSSLTDFKFNTLKIIPYYLFYQRNQSAQYVLESVQIQFSVPHDFKNSTNNHNDDPELASQKVKLCLLIYVPAWAANETPLKRR